MSTYIVYKLTYLPKNKVYFGYTKRSLGHVLDLIYYIGQGAGVPELAEDATKETDKTKWTVEKVHPEKVGKGGARYVIFCLASKCTSELYQDVGEKPKEVVGKPLALYPIEDRLPIVRQRLLKYKNWGFSVCNEKTIQYQMISSLKILYPKLDVIPEYRFENNKRCDLYIPELKLIVELKARWSYGERQKATEQLSMYKELMPDHTVILVVVSKKPISTLDGNHTYNSFFELIASLV